VGRMDELSLRRIGTQCIGSVLQWAEKRGFCLRCSRATELSVGNVAGMLLLELLGLHSGFYALYVMKTELGLNTGALRWCVQVRVHALLDVELGGVLSGSGNRHFSGF
jgi:hypothetical protein